MLLTSTKDLPAFPRKIISLVPSQTELLDYLGLQKEVIGITKFCVYPADWLKTKTSIGGTKNVNIQKVQQLKPDLIAGSCLHLVTLIIFLNHFHCSVMS